LRRLVLGRDGREVVAVVPSAKDGLHCGLASEIRLLPTVSVVPSAKDGLHCGREGGQAQKSGRPGSSRPPRTGSIAAAFMSSDAAVYGVVVPSAKDGLHCGFRSTQTCAPSAMVVPSAKDGLHCGRTQDGNRYAITGTSSRPPRTGSIAAA